MRVFIMASGDSLYGRFPGFEGLRSWVWDEVIEPLTEMNNALP